MTESVPSRTRHGSPGGRERSSSRRSIGGRWWLALALVVAAGWVAMRSWPGAQEFNGAESAALAPLASVTGCTGRDLHVTVDGSSQGDGSEAGPLDLATALSAASPARSCDTIWLHGGTYTGAYVSALRGNESGPIVVRQATGERVALDGGDSTLPVLTANGAYTWFWGFEVLSSSADRSSSEPVAWPGDLTRSTGLNVVGSNLKFINLVVHDLARGFEIGTQALNVEVYGSLIYYNGWEGPDRAPNGHGIDTHNRVGQRHIRDNIIFNQFSHGLIAYGSGEASIDNISLEGNVFFNNGALSKNLVERDVLVGGATLAKNVVLRQNMTFGGAQTAIGYGAGCSGANVEDNYLAGGPLLMGQCDGVVKGNTLLGSPKEFQTTYPDNMYVQGRPTGTLTRVRPNRYEPGRANIAVYNWDKLPEVAIDLSGSGLIVGAEFEIRDAQDFYGEPVARGTLSSSPVTVSMGKLSAARPVGNALQPPHTGPDFAAFVVVPATVPKR